MNCPQCGAPVTEGDPFCGNCGAKLSGTTGMKNCVSCGNPMPQNDRFCARCGADQLAAGSQASGQGYAQNGQQGYAQNNQQGYGQNPYAQNGQGYGSNPYAQNGQQGYGSNPYAQNGQGYGSNPFANSQQSYENPFIDSGSQQGYDQNAGQNNFNQGQQGYNQNQSQNNGGAKKKKPGFEIGNKKGLIIGIAVAAAILVVALGYMIYTMLNPTINLNKYVDVSFTGYNTVGKAEVVFNTTKFDSDYGKKLAKKSGTSILGNEVAELILASYIGYDLDKSSGLSNGDKVTLTWNCDDAQIKQLYGYKLKYKEKTYKVSGLEEISSFDPFEGIEVTFTGLDGEGYGEITGEATAAEAAGLSYNFDDNGGFTNGDTATVSVTYDYGDPVDYCVENYGKIPSPVTKEFTVEGLGHYVTALDEITEDALTDVNTQAKDDFTSYMAQRNDETESVKSIDYIGDYLLIPKSGSGNKLYVIYKVVVNDKYSYDGSSYNKNNTFYWYMEYSDVVVNSEGELSIDVLNYSKTYDDVSFDSEVSTGWWSTKTWTYDGYETMDALYNDVIASNASSYNHEENVDEDSADSKDDDDDSDSDKDAESTNAEKYKDCIFPTSSDKKLTQDQVDALSDDDLGYALNELYARHGYIFTTDKYKDYYKKFSWYKGTKSTQEAAEADFNDVELYNKNLLAAERDDRK